MHKRIAKGNISDSSNIKNNGFVKEIKKIKKDEEIVNTRINQLIALKKKPESKDHKLIFMLNKPDLYLENQYIFYFVRCCLIANFTFEPIV